MRARILVSALTFAAAGLLAPQAVSTADSPPESPDARTAPPVERPVDPCADYQQLEAGTGAPERQGTFNLLDARGYARWRMACVYQWGTPEWECVDRLWREESGWDHLVANGSGIPQAMPARKMAAAGPDWRTNPRTQVRWGLSYIAGRYGTPLATPRRCAAGY